MARIKGMVPAVAATVAATAARIEIVAERRRMHDAEFRARVIEASLMPGARVQDLARRYGLCTSLIYRWRRAAAPHGTSTSTVRPDALGATPPSKALVADAPLEFMPVGVVGCSDDGGPALVARSSSAPEAQSSSGCAPLPRPATEERPGVIEIDLACGTRLRVDAFVNERALRRVLAVLRTAS